MKLDYTRPYGTITGDDQGRSFEQDHKFFAADGTEWIDPAQPKAKAQPKPKAETVPTDVVMQADPQLAAQLA